MTYRNECAICCIVSSLRLEKEDDGQDVVEEEEEEEGDQERVFESDAIPLVKILDVHLFEGVLQEKKKRKRKLNDEMSHFSNELLRNRPRLQLKKYVTSSKKAVFTQKVGEGLLKRGAKRAVYV